MSSPVLNYAKYGGDSKPNLPNAHGINGGSTFVSNNKPYAVNGGNTQYTGSLTSKEAMAGAGVYKITSGGSGGSGKGMSGGGRSRRHRRSRASKKYARKRSLRHRLKHIKSGKRKHGHRHTKRRGQRGGYAQYLSNQAFTLGQRLPGFPLLPKLSALANPPPFMPYRNCPGGM